MEKPEQQHITGTLESAPTRKKRVLVVDDSADLLSLSKTVLEIDDYEVFTDLSGKDALVVLAEIAQPDLILLDMRMEDMSGPEFLLVLEETRPEIVENVPVVFITGMDKIPASKAAGFINKPFDMDTFLAAVHRFIEIGTNRIRSNLKMSEDAKLIHLACLPRIGDRHGEEQKI